MPTSVGQVMLRQVVPDDIDLKGRTLDKNGIKDVMREVEEKHPERYAETLRHLIQLGKTSAYTQGVSINLRDLLPSKAKKAALAPLKRRIEQIKAMKLQPDDEERLIVAAAAPFAEKVQNAVMAEGLANNSPHARMVAAGVKGKPEQLNALVGAEVMYNDHNGDPVPMLIENSYADGLDPAEYWAASYGSRKGLVDVKMATADAGYMSKRLINAAHRQVVTDEKPIDSRLPVGYPTTADDHDNVGAVLSMPVGGYEPGTVITPTILKDIKRKHKDKRFLVHSALTSRTQGGGLDRMAAGVREKRGLAAIGENLGIPAAQAVGERISQGALNSKHTAGAAGTDQLERGGFEYLDRLIEAPETFKEAGAITKIDGRVKSVEEAPQGGYYVDVDDERIYVPEHRKVTVKAGDELEAGDMVSDGIPHPRDLVKYQGIGEARRKFTEMFVEALKNSGVSVHRRNAEALAAGLINHVKITDLDGVGDYIVDDVAPYSAVFGGNYAPREGTQRQPLKAARGKYLEEPVLHYTPGTRLTKRVLKDLGEFGVQDVDTHAQMPGFEPEMVRGVMNLTKDPDWQTQLAGFYTGKTFINSVRRGAGSQGRGSTSFYGALSKGDTFGKDLKTKGTF